MRNTFDFAPYRRTTVGFDKLFDILESNLRAGGAEGYPPFDIERLSNDTYRITLAVAGFKRDEIDVTAQQNQVTVTGRKEEDSSDDGRYLHRGIAARSFDRTFQLADFIQVRSASFDDGLLRIDLQREIPEAMMPRKISIAGSSDQSQLDAPPANDRQAA